MAFNYVTPARFPYVQTEQGKFDLDRFDPEFFAHYEERIRDLQALASKPTSFCFTPTTHGDSRPWISGTTKPT